MLDLTIPTRRDPGLTDGARDDLIEAQAEMAAALPVLEKLISLLRYAEHLGADVEFQNECQEIEGSINGAIEDINGAIEDINEKVGEE
mgnify:FL=1